MIGVAATRAARAFSSRIREEMVGRRRGEGWEVVVVADDGRRVTFKVPPGIPSVDPSALVLMKRRM
jgi:hypothetical protein